MTPSLPRAFRSVLLCLSLATGLLAADPAKPARETFVIVHGAWAGGWEHKQLAEALEADGHKVIRVTLTGHGERSHLASPEVDLNVHIQDAVNVIEWENLRDFVLVGHSYGGVVITGVIDRVHARIKHAVYLDAGLPEHGENATQAIAGDKPPRWKAVDGFIPLSDQTPKAVPHIVAQSEKTFTTPITLVNQEQARRVPTTYILTVDPGKKPEEDMFHRAYLRAQARGWRTVIQEGDHVVHLTRTAETAKLIEEAAASSGTASAPAVVIIENGGTGPFPAIATEDATLPGMTLFLPRDLTPFGRDLKLPVMLWGNGACANTAQEHKNFLNEIASQGYLVLAIGRLDQIERRPEGPRQPTDAKQLLAALDWITAQNAAAGSRFQDKIDLTKVAAAGMSCGGLQAIEISGDPRITTTIVCNSGVLPSPSTRPGMPAIGKDALLKYHAPVLYIIGGPSDIAYHNAMDDFARVNHVPFVMTNLDVGHGGTYGQPHGGEFTRVALAWLDWQLKGRTDASRLFLGTSPELTRDSKWTVETKGFAETR